MPPLKDKVTVVTGASSGIGETTALHFAELGAKLMLSGRNEENLNRVVEECKRRGAEASAVRGDLTDESHLRELVDKTIEVFGRIDVLVNNAGIFVLDSIRSDSMETYDQTMQINLRAAVRLTMLASPHLVESKGAVVNVSSMAGTRSFPGLLSYCMSKAALDQFTACVALELASKQVRVNSVNPGMVATNMHRRGGLSEEQVAQLKEYHTGSHPLGRIGESLEVAKAIAYLASDDASFTTGQTLSVDGGCHVKCLS